MKYLLDTHALICTSRTMTNMMWTGFGKPQVKNRNKKSEKCEKKLPSLAFLYT